MLQIHDIPKNYYQLQLSGQLMVVHFQKGGEKKGDNNAETCKASQATKPTNRE